MGGRIRSGDSSSVSSSLTSEVVSFADPFYDDVYTSNTPNGGDPNDTTAPKLSGGTPSFSTDGSSFSINFNEAIDNSDDSFSAAGFKLYIDGAPTTLNSDDLTLSDDGKSISFSIDSTSTQIYKESEVLLAYDSESGTLDDAANNSVQSFIKTVYTDSLTNSRDQSAPELSGGTPSFSTDGSSFSINFNEAIDNSDDSFSAAGFKLYIDGAAFTLDPDDVTLAQDGSSVEFSLTNGPKVYENSQVLLAYDADSGNLEDAAQNPFSPSLLPSIPTAHLSCPTIARLLSPVQLA